MKINICYLLTVVTIYLFMASTSKAQNKKTSDTTLSIKPDSGLINIPYGRQPAKYITSAISGVYGNDIKQNFNTNLGNTLYGRVPGLFVTQSGTGEPGLNSPSFNIRGVNTFSQAVALANGTTFGSGTAPLIVVDGFTNNFVQLIPDEIESINILKDAAATAIYGLQGANGVILVTTKRGKIQPMAVTFSAQTGFNQAEYLPKFLGAYDYARLNNEARKNDGLTPIYSDADLAAYQNGSDPYFHPDVNWYNQVLRKTAPVSQYGLSFNGGTNEVRYHVVLNAIGSGGLTQNFGDKDSESSNSTYNRYNFRSNLDLALTKRLSATFLLGGTVEDKSNPYNYNLSGLFNTLALLPPNAIPIRNQDGTLAGNNAYTNPLGDVSKTGFYSTNGRTIQSSLRLTEQLDMITKGLSISAAYSLNTYFTSYSSKTKTYQRNSYSVNPATGVVTGPTSFGVPTSLVSSETQTDQFNSNTFLADLDYNHSFGRHQLSGLLLFKSEGVNISNTGSGRNSLPYSHIGGGGRLTDVYNDKYIAEFSFGYQGSEQFPSGSRYGFFPAASLGWILSNENFLKNSATVSFLKLRGSYGITGNDNIANFTNASSPRFAFTQYYPFIASYYFGTGNSSVGALAEGPLANTNVTWERENKLNIGFNVTLFKQLQFTFDAFKNDRSNILASPAGAIPQLSGITLSYLNLGKSTNKGFDGSAKYSSNLKGNLQYFIEADLSYATNKIIYNAEKTPLNPYQATTGTIIGQPFGYVALGLFTPEQIANAAIAKPVGIAVQAGDIRYADLNNDGKIDQNDTRAIGHPGLPNFSGGLHTGITYRNFDLDLVFQGVSGNTMYLGGSYYQAFQNNGQIGPIALNRYTPQTATTATYPRLSTSGNQNNYQFSTYWQRNGDFIKFRSAELGYNFSAALVRKIKLKGARLFVNGTNLFILDHLDNTDPESLSGYPPQRTISIGARVNL